MRIALTNLGQYNEGILNYVWLTLPATDEEIEEAKEKIGIDYEEYEEYFITDYDDAPEGLGEYESIDRLNEIAEKLEDDEDLFEAICEYGGVETALEADFDEWDLRSDIRDDEDLGWYYAEEVGGLEIPENIKPYFDYERYGRDIRYEVSGAFTSYGWLECYR